MLEYFSLSFRQRFEMNDIVREGGGSLFRGYLVEERFGGVVVKGGAAGFRGEIEVLLFEKLIARRDIYLEFVCLEKYSIFSILSFMHAIIKIFLNDLT